MVFAMSGLLSAWLHATPTFPDPDSFYHAKLSLLLARRGVFTTFPWLAFTTLKSQFADHQFLYHVLLIPWVYLWPPLVGLKLFTVTAFAAAVTAFYALLCHWRVRWPGLYTMVLLTANPFLFRANLAKAQPVVFAVLFLSLRYVFPPRPWALGVASFLYVWLYGGWPVLVGLVGLTAVVVTLWPRVTRGRVPRQPVGRALAAVLGGAALALVASPYFPTNVAMYWNQIVHVAVINYQRVIGVGAEWYPYPAHELAVVAPLVTFLALVGGCTYAMRFRQQGVRSTVLLVAMLGWVALTLRSRRNIEYLIPFALLFAAVAIDAGLRGLDPRRFTRELGEFLAGKKLLLAGAVLPLALIPPLIFQQLRDVLSAYASGIPFTRLQGAARWLARHTAPGTVVFHSDWDEFPLLFYPNSANYYIVGLDPTFLYRYDPARYQQWERVTTGRERARLHQVVAESFGARYVVVTPDRHDALAKLLRKAPGFQLVYRDAEAEVYEVLEIPNPKHRIPNTTP